MPKRFQLGIRGLGVVGAALLLLAVLWSSFKTIVAWERRPGPGQVNSSPEANSHTVHRARAESNYGIKKALMVSAMADLLIAIVLRYFPEVGRKMPTHLLAVGEKEVAAFRKLFAERSPHFSDLRLLERDEIAQIEPALMEGRDPRVPVVSLYTEEGYAVDFERLALAMIALAVREAERRGKTLEIHYNTEVVGTERIDTGFRVTTADGDVYEVRSLEICSGNASLLAARELGFGHNFAMVSVGGSYFVADCLIDGKVYGYNEEGMQNAAVHVDKDVNRPHLMRFGPTADLPPFFLPFLERGSWKSIGEYFRMGMTEPRSLYAVVRATLSWKYLRFGLRSFLFKLPFVGKRIFARLEAQKLIPAILARHLRLVKGAGGIRGQLVDKATYTMADTTRIEAPEGVHANCVVSPSPGATACIWNALLSLLNHCRWQGETFYEEQMFADLFGADAAAKMARFKTA